MKKILILGLLLAGLSLLVIFGCAPTEPKSEEELFLEEISEPNALAGQAVQLRCRTQRVLSCNDNGDGSYTVKYERRRGAAAVTRIVRNSCISRAGSPVQLTLNVNCASSTSVEFCTNRCESGESCQAGQCISACGNGRVDVRENCGTCPADVRCAEGQVCEEGACVESCIPSPEVCDGVDNSCDGAVDEGGVCNTASNCGTFGNACAAGQSCQAGVCTIITELTELCDNLDNNANGQVDEGCDDDNDGYCDSNMAFTPVSDTSYPSSTCVSGIFPWNRGSNCCWSGNDCDDTNRDMFPRPGFEDRFQCEGNGYVNVDNNCNGIVDDGCETICDDLDNNGNGLVDDGCDLDGDDYCRSTNGFTVVGTPAVCPNGGGDCGDWNETIYPGAVERCFDRIDQNCVGGVDEGCSPYTCVDNDPENDLLVGGNITITSANGDYFQISDGCESSTTINQSICVNASGSQWENIIGLVLGSCPSGTTCTYPDGPAGATPAVCTTIT